METARQEEQAFSDLESSFDRKNDVSKTIFDRDDSPNIHTAKCNPSFTVVIVVI